MPVLQSPIIPDIACISQQNKAINSETISIKNLNILENPMKRYSSSQILCTSSINEYDDCNSMVAFHQSYLHTHPEIINIPSKFKIYFKSEKVACKPKENETSLVRL